MLSLIVALLRDTREKLDVIMFVFSNKLAKADESSWKTDCTGENAQSASTLAIKIAKCAI